jgi:hypothetical protein
VGVETRTDLVVGFLSKCRVNIEGGKGNVLAA